MEKENKLKKLNRTTKDQLEVIVTFMEKHPELVERQTTESFTQHEKQRLWKELKKELNSKNSSIPKTVNQWRRSWLDKKNNVRSKAKLFVKNMKNNEQKKIIKFTLLEKRIMKLIGLRTLSQICPTYVPPHFHPEKPTEHQLENSGPKILFSVSLLPTMTKYQSEELMEIDSDKQPKVNGVLKSETVTSKDISILTGETCLSEGVSSEDVPMEVKQEPPDDTFCKTSSSSALELVNPVIVSVAPISTAGESLLPLVKLATPGLTERIEPHSPVIGSPASSSLTEDSQSNSIPNTAQGTKPESRVIELDSDNPMKSTEELFKKLRKETNLSFLLNEGRRNAYSFNKGKQSIAIKAANALTDMAERNCIVLERIATAIEIQAAQSVKQTQLIDKLINILAKN